MRRMCSGVAASRSDIIIHAAPKAWRCVHTHTQPHVHAPPPLHPPLSTNVAGRLLAYGTRPIPSASTCRHGWSRSSTQPLAGPRIAAPRPPLA
eukprot:scaffold289055_cov41-Tisochrysis_lutea.AAC.1